MNPEALLEHMTIELHRLIREGQGDSEEADALREQMYEAWSAQGPEKRALLDSLSGDLYMLAGEEIFEGAAEDPKLLRSQLKAAWNAQDWGRVLSLLRHEGIHDVEPEPWRAYYRACAWSNLGYLEAASCFFDHAQRLSPTNDNYVYLALDALVRIGRISEALGRANAIIRNEASSPRLLFKASEVLFHHAVHRLREETAEIVYKRVLIVLEKAFDRNAKLTEGQRLPSLMISGYIHMGFCHQHLRHIDRAKEAFTSALRIDPENDAALVARGLLLYETERDAALKDFERAAATGTPLVWPYLYLAHDALTSGELRRCLEMAGRAEKRTRDPKLRANLLEWIAIARVQLGGSIELAIGLLLEAQTIEPFNERIIANYERIIASRQAEQNLVIGNDTTPMEASEQLSRELQMAA